MTNKGPEWQAVFGPISTAELIKGALLSKYPPPVWPLGGARFEFR